MVERTRRSDELEIAEAALERSEADRAAFLDDACGRDAALRARVEALVRRTADEDGFLRPVSAESISRLLARTELIRPGVRIGPVTVERELGRGGMGAVFLARQEQPRRLVALKVMATGLRAHERRRFVLEIEHLGRLDHPGVAHVYDAGVYELPSGASLPWYTMEHVDGATNVVEFARRRALRPRDALRLFLRVGDAIQDVHDRGVIHRDLKPSNLLVNADGQPKAIDFGIARAADRSDASFHTEPGVAIGTPAYMSPEQARGDSRDVTVQSDVYALGAVLYEMIAGKRPLSFEGASRTQVLARIQNEVPPPPSARNAAVVRPLDWIVGKALEKETGRRYASVAELADDLHRFLRHEPVRARPPSATYVLRTYARRHWAMLSIVLVVVTSATVVAAQAVDRAREESAQATRITALERARSEELRRRLWTVHERLYQIGDWAGAAEQLEEALETSPPQAVRLRLRHARCMLALGEHERAGDELEALEEAVLGDPALRAEWQLLRGVWTFGEVDPRNDGRIDLDGLDIDALSPSDGFYVLGLRATTTADANRFFSAATAEDPGHFFAWHGRLMTLFLMGRWTDTSRLARSVTERFPADVYAHAFEALAHMMLGHEETAFEIARGATFTEEAAAQLDTLLRVLHDVRALVANPGAPPWITFGRATKMVAGLSSEVDARTLFSHVNFQSASAVRSYGRLPEVVGAVIRGDVDAAADVLDDAAALAPSSIFFVLQGLFLYGYRDDPDHARAEAAFARSLELDPLTPEFRTYAIYGRMACLVALIEAGDETARARLADTLRLIADDPPPDDVQAASNVSRAIIARDPLLARGFLRGVVGRTTATEAALVPYFRAGIADLEENWVEAYEAATDALALGLADDEDERTVRVIRGRSLERLRAWIVAHPEVLAEDGVTPGPAR